MSNYSHIPDKILSDISLQLVNSTDVGTIINLLQRSGFSTSKSEYNELKDIAGGKKFDYLKGVLLKYPYGLNLEPLLKLADFITDSQYIRTDYYSPNTKQLKELSIKLKDNIEKIYISHFCPPYIHDILLETPKQLLENNKDKEAVSSAIKLLEKYRQNNYHDEKELNRIDLETMIIKREQDNITNLLSALQYLYKIEFLLQALDKIKSP